MKSTNLDRATTVPDDLRIRINPFIRLCGRLWFSLKKPFLLRRVKTICIEYIDGIPLLSIPEVFNAVVFRGGEFMARTLAHHQCAELPPSTSAPTALDMGTGSGVAAIFAALRGYKVIGVDINPKAVQCARMNVLMNNLEEKVEIREGDLFNPVTGERFHLVIFNPPFYRGNPENMYDMAWRSNDVIERFVSGLESILSPDGLALILLSTDGEPNCMLDALVAHSFQIEPVTSRHFGNEKMTIYSARLANVKKR